MDKARTSMKLLLKTRASSTDESSGGTPLTLTIITQNLKVTNGVKNSKLGIRLTLMITPEYGTNQRSKTRSTGRTLITLQGHRLWSIRLASVPLIQKETKKITRAIDTSGGLRPSMSGYQPTALVYKR
jgi:hypothetical protein